MLATGRPRAGSALRQRDRVLWAWRARLWNGWRAALLNVKPETVIQWHRQGSKPIANPFIWSSIARPGTMSANRDFLPLVLSRCF